MNSDVRDVTCVTQSGISEDESNCVKSCEIKLKKFDTNVRDDNIDLKKDKFALMKTGCESEWSPIQVLNRTNTIDIAQIDNGSPVGRVVCR